MAQSLSKIYVHLIFSTKDRERTLPDEIRPDLHAYMGGTLKGLGCLPIRNQHRARPPVQLQCYSAHICGEGHRSC